MAVSNVELYEALKSKIGEEAARLMANVIPAAENLATKDDLSETKGALRYELAETKAELKAEIVGTKAELKAQIADTKAELTSQIADVGVQVARLDTKIEASAKETMRWMLMFFIPVWAGTWGTVVAVLLKR